MNIDIERLKDIRDELAGLDKDEAIFIDENGYSKYVIITSETYDKVEDLLMAINGTEIFKPEIRVIGNDSELTYEEYERIKAVIMEVVEKTLKPKAEKLN